jgi:hypothetical protein
MHEPTAPMTFLRRPRAVLVLLLLMAARDEGCNFSIGPDGLCASLRLEPGSSVIRVGESFRLRVNADGCSAAGGCPCADSAAALARWTSEDPRTVSVNSSGVVLGRRPGAADVVLRPATAGGWQRTRVHVTVVP